MNFRVCTILGALVLMLTSTGNSPAIAAVASTADAPSAVAAPLPEGESSSSLLCGLNRSVTTKLPVTQPAPFLKTAAPCGSCSNYSCRTHSVGSVCAVAPGKTYYCLDYYGTTCPADGGVNCVCASGVP